jgi:ribosomal-protein-alanine N-acetyltransferase
MNVPSQGNPTVRVRAATVGDIPAILAVDTRCFSVEWRKDDVQISLALHEPRVSWSSKKTWKWSVTPS